MEGSDCTLIEDRLTIIIIIISGYTVLVRTLGALYVY
jgi:hypothetical protein